MKSIIVGNFIFEPISMAYPEQYDVIDEHGIRVGYVRMRNGSVHAYSTVGNSYIYRAAVEGSDGCFRTEEQRAQHLIKIADRFKRFLYVVECPACGDRQVWDTSHIDDMDNNCEAVFDCECCGHIFTVKDSDDGLYTYEGKTKKTWRIPVVWQETGIVEIDACTLAEAIEIIKDEASLIPLPEETYYMDGSWELREADIDVLRNVYNYDQEDA